MDNIIKPEILKSVSEISQPATRYAYYMQPISGGYQVHRLTIQEDVVLSDEKIEDPDGWPEALGYLEKEFTKEHFAE